MGEGERERSFFWRFGERGLDEFAWVGASEESRRLDHSSLVGNAISSLLTVHPPRPNQVMDVSSFAASHVDKVALHQNTLSTTEHQVPSKHPRRTRLACPRASSIAPPPQVTHAAFFNSLGFPWSVRLVGIQFYKGGRDKRLLNDFTILLVPTLLQSTI